MGGEGPPMRKTIILAVVCLSLVVGVVCAQDAVPVEIMQRTLLIKNDAANKYGTAFFVDHKGVAYLVTARHMVEGLPATKATIGVWKDNTWKSLQTVKTLFPKSNEVDIAVLKLDEKVPTPFPIQPHDDTAGPTMGQSLWFLGYPFQLGTTFSPNAHWDGGTPFIKRGTMSALNGSNPDAIVYYIDGFNNPGFSGGPILYWSFSKHVYQILGVVKGFKPEAAQIVVNGQPVDTQVMVNSGILIAYDIKHAVDAIDADNK
jgi:S1-C subfamily serine protease